MRGSKVSWVKKVGGAARKLQFFPTESGKFWQRIW